LHSGQITNNLFVSKIVNQQLNFFRSKKKLG
jgi:hypothetical protein